MTPEPKDSERKLLDDFDNKIFIVREHDKKYDVLTGVALSIYDAETLSRLAREGLELRKIKTDAAAFIKAWNKWAFNSEQALSEDRIETAHALAENFTNNAPE